VFQYVRAPIPGTEPDNETDSRPRAELTPIPAGYGRAVRGWGADALEGEYRGLGGGGGGKGLASCEGARGVRGGMPSGRHLARRADMTLGWPVPSTAAHAPRWPTR